MATHADTSKSLLWRFCACFLTLLGIVLGMVAALFMCGLVAAFAMHVVWQPSAMIWGVLVIPALLVVPWLWQRLVDAVFVRWHRRNMTIAIARWHG